LKHFTDLENFAVLKNLNLFSRALICQQVCEKLLSISPEYIALRFFSFASMQNTAANQLYDAGKISHPAPLSVLSSLASSPLGHPAGPPPTHPATRPAHPTDRWATRPPTTSSLLPIPPPLPLLTPIPGILTLQELYTEGVGGVLAHFQEKEALNLFYTLQKLQHTIKEGTKTYLGVLSLIYPLLAVVYRSALMSSIPSFSKLEEWKTMPSICDVCHFFFGFGGFSEFLEFLGFWSFLESFWSFLVL
jgi:hypothetical protein